jgi:hypothetical protein
VGGDRTHDWAVLRITDPVLEPVHLWRGRFVFADSDEPITLFNVGIGPVTEAADLSPKVHVVGGTIVGIHSTVFHYHAPTFKGDSGGPIIYNAAGEVCGMHIQQINKVPEQVAGAAAEELRSSSLSGSTAHLGEALRIDVILPRVVALCGGELN